MKKWLETLEQYINDNTTIDLDNLTIDLDNKKICIELCIETNVGIKFIYYELKIKRKHINMIDIGDSIYELKDALINLDLEAIENILVKDFI